MKSLQRSRYGHNNTSCASPTLNGSQEILHFECSDVHDHNTQRNNVCFVLGTATSCTTIRTCSSRNSQSCGNFLKMSVLTRHISQDGKKLQTSSVGCF